jgi:hypothetical protein
MANHLYAVEDYVRGLPSALLDETASDQQSAAAAGDAETFV